MAHAAAAHSAHDTTHGHPPTSTGLDNKKIAIWAFIGSECMLFASLISTYLIYKGRSRIGPMPHEWSCKTSAAVAKTRELLQGCAPADVLKPILDIPVTSQSTVVRPRAPRGEVGRASWVGRRVRTRPRGLA